MSGLGGSRLAAETAGPDAAREVSGLAAAELPGCASSVAAGQEARTYAGVEGDTAGTSSSTPSAQYGGNFTWVGAHYKMRVKAGISPLQWLNGLTKRLLLLDDIVLHADGGFRRPGESVPLFPRGGVELRWRWDAAERRIIIDFSSDGKLMPWRWDELTPCPELRFPSTVPDLQGIGHVGRFSFEYSLLSAVAEDQRPTPAAPVEVPPQPRLPCSWAKEPRGTCELSCTTSGTAEAALAEEPPRLLLFGPELQEPLLLAEQPGADAGARRRGAAEEAPSALAERLREALLQACGPGAAPEGPRLGRLAEQLARAVAADRGAMAAAVGLALAPAAQPPLPLLQPVCILVCLGQPLEFRLLTYGFVPSGPVQVQDAAPEDGAPQCLVRLLSPELSAGPVEGQVFHYFVQPARAASMASCLEPELSIWREAVRVGQWSPLL